LKSRPASTAVLAEVIGTSRKEHFGHVGRYTKLTGRFWAPSPAHLKGTGEEMSRYLIVAHRTADSPMLLAKVQELVAEDPGVEFVVLTPRRSLTALELVAGGQGRSATSVAIRRGKRTVRRIESVGARVIDSRLGGFDALEAISDELGFAQFDGVIISTLPRRLSAWLRQDIPAKICARFPQVLVIHVIAPNAYYREGEPVRSQSQS